MRTLGGTSEHHSAAVSRITELEQTPDPAGNKARRNSLDCEPLLAVLLVDRAPVDIVPSCVGVGPEHVFLQDVVQDLGLGGADGDGGAAADSHGFPG